MSENLYAVDVEWTAHETVYVVADSKREAEELAVEDADSSMLDLEAEAHATPQALPPHEKILREPFICSVGSTAENIPTIGEWWELGGPEREAGMTPDERARLYREQVEAAGQQRLWTVPEAEADPYLMGIPVRSGGHDV